MNYRDQSTDTKQLATSLELCRKVGIYIPKMTFVKINVDKVSLKVLFKSMAKINDKMSETSFVHATTKHLLKIELQG